MNSLPLFYEPKDGILYKFAIFIFILILTLHGTYLRFHNPADVAEMNILVLARLLVCSIAFVVGILLIPKKAEWGVGSKALLFYILASGISAANSPYPVIVIGYLILLLGASFLMIGLVYHAQNLVQLERIETIWFITGCVLILKDTLTSILFPEMQPSEDLTRLGMGVTQANTLSFYAGLIFWLSFGNKKNKHTAFIWLLRTFLIYVIIGAISRVTIAAFLISGFFYCLFKKGDNLTRLIIVFTGISITLFFSLSLSLEHEWSKKIVTYIKRGQDTTELSSFTGRTSVWPYILKKSLELPVTGHGYAISRLTLGTFPNATFSTPSNCHNVYLEVFFNTGLLGLIPFLVMLMYNMKWVINYSTMSKIYSTDLALHSVCVIAMLIVFSIFEAGLGGKIDPTVLLFFLYLLSIDRKKQFLTQKKILYEDKKKGAPIIGYSK